MTATTTTTTQTEIQLIVGSRYHELIESADSVVRALSLCVYVWVGGLGWCIT